MNKNLSKVYEDRRGFKYTLKELQGILEAQRDLYPNTSFEDWIEINVNNGQLFPMQ